MEATWKSPSPTDAAAPLEVPDGALVVLIGAAGSGKTTFAESRFKPTEVISSDRLRGMVADNERNQSATPAAFQVLHLIAGLRLERRRLTVIDAVNARPQDRRPLIALARQHDTAAVAMVLDLPEAECVARDHARPGRSVGATVIRAQHRAIRQSLGGLREEGFDHVHVVRTPGTLDQLVLRRVRLAVDRRWERGPFDVIGAVRGHLTELLRLLESLGYVLERGSEGTVASARHPDGRKAIFCGDLAGQAPESMTVLDLVMGMAADKSALCIRGDHEERLLQAEASAVPNATRQFVAGLPSHYVLAAGKLVVTHAGIQRQMVNRDSERVRTYCLVGEPGWQKRWRGRAVVVHTHEPGPSPQWQGRTLGLGGDSVGGGLSALRFPELEIVSVSDESRF